MVTTELAAPTEPAAVPLRPRWALWRSPADQPGYARPALLAITAVAAVLYAWNINHSGYHGFYADAARSMSENWKAFVFGSFDPANTITIDKLPGFLWPQALSAMLFGFHPWSLTLPQVIEGVLAVLVMYRTVRRWAGANAALIAAAAFTLTPVLAGLFRTAVEDPAFTLLLLLAADAALRAAQTARLCPLLLAGVWVGLAFQAKMLEAWAVLPALAAVYLLAAPTRLRRRFGHLALAGLVTVAVSASWVLLVTLTPAQDRPYVDGTTDNSAYSMVVGYNFLNRFSSVGLNADDTGSVQTSRGGGGWGHSADRGAAMGGAAGSSTLGQAAYGGGESQQGQGQQGQGQQGQGHSGGESAGGSGERGSGSAGAPMGGGGSRGGDGGWTKMFGSQFGSQTGWLYPLAAIAVICGVAWRRGRPRTDVLRAGFVLWGAWVAVFFLVFSAGSVGGHSYYMGVVGAPLAALSGAGIVVLWRGFRAGGRRALALPVAVAGTVAWCAVLAWRFPDFLPWLAPAAIALGVVALALLGAARLGRTAGRFGGRRLALAGLLAGIAAMLVAPGAWAASVLDPKYGNSGMGTVGPSGASGFGGGGRQLNPALEAELSRYLAAARGGGGGGFGDGSSKLTAGQQALFGYAKAHQDGATYLFATTSWSAASPFILATGQEVLPMGGFTGAVPSPTLGQFQELVDSGKLHLVLAGAERGMGGGSMGGGTGASTAEILSWVRNACTVVPPADYGAAVSPGGFGMSAQQLYSCSR